MNDFPIDKVSLPWSVLYAAFAALVDERSPEQRDSLFSGTARRVYRI